MPVNRTIAAKTVFDSLFIYINSAKALNNNAGKGTAATRK